MGPFFLALVSRRIFGPAIASFTATTAVADVGDILQSSLRASDITYSSNAKNLVRMSQGDMSMGSKQTSQTERGLKRRATMGCKSVKARQEANVYRDEADCTRAVLAGDQEAILAALARLGDDCKVDATHVCM